MSDEHDPRLAEQWADVIVCSLPTFKEDDGFDAARKTVKEFVAMILADPGKYNGFDSRDARVTPPVGFCANCCSQPSEPGRPFCHECETP